MSLKKTPTEEFNAFKIKVVKLPKDVVTGME